LTINQRDFITNLPQGKRTYGDMGDLTSNQKQHPNFHQHKWRVLEKYKENKIEMTITERCRICANLRRRFTTLSASTPFIIKDTYQKPEITVNNETIITQPPVSDESKIQNNA